MVAQFHHDPDRGEGDGREVEERRFQGEREGQRAEAPRQHRIRTMRVHVIRLTHQRDAGAEHQAACEVSEHRARAAGVESIPEADALQEGDAGDHHREPAAAGEVGPVMPHHEHHRRAEEQHPEGAEHEGHAAGAGFFLGIAGENLVPLAGLQDALFVPELGFLRQPFAEALGEGHGGKMENLGTRGEGEGGLDRVGAVGG